MVIVVALMVANSYDVATDLNDLLDDTKCYSCASDSQKLQSLAAVLWDAFLSREDITDLKTDARCLLCLKPGQLKGLALGLICQYIGSIQ